ncbi:MAG: serine protease, partial [Gemmobacter sp.]
MKRMLGVFALAGTLAGCGGGGTGTVPDYRGLNVPRTPTGDPAATSGTLPAPWNRHFVTAFDPAVIAAVRAQPGYVGNQLSYDLTVEGHPTLAGGGTLSGQPLLASRLDHAHSVGLTGAGQTLSMIDDAPRRSHQQFAGTNFVTSGLQFTGTHGTGVASVLVGNGVAVTTGYAPGARLHAAEMRYGGAT